MNVKITLFNSPGFFWKVYFLFNFYLCPDYLNQGIIAMSYNFNNL